MKKIKLLLCTILLFCSMTGYGASYLIIVKNMKGEMNYVPVESTQLVLTLKQQVSVGWVVDVSKVILVFKNVVLIDERRLDEYNIIECSIVYVVINK